MNPDELERELIPLTVRAGLKGFSLVRIPLEDDASGNFQKPFGCTSRAMEDYHLAKTIIGINRAWKFKSSPFSYTLALPPEYFDTEKDYIELTEKYIISCFYKIQIPQMVAATRIDKAQSYGFIEIKDYVDLGPWGMVDI